jgi:hypothetical protein
MPTDTTKTAPNHEAHRRVRGTIFKVVAALLSLALLITGARLLITGWFDPKGAGIHRFQDLAWGVIEGVILLAGIAAQLWRPARRVVALQQALAGFVALALTMVLALSVDPPTIVASALFALLVILHPARAKLPRVIGEPDPVRLLIALLGGVALLVFALHEASLARTTAASNPLAQAAGFGGACAAAIGVTLVALLAAVRGGRTLPAWSATAGALVLGIGSIAFPHHPSSLGQAGGAIAIAGAIVFLGATLRTRRYSRETQWLNWWSERTPAERRA